MGKKMLGLMLIGLTIPGFVFTGLIWLGYQGVYGQTGIGGYNLFVPLTITIIMLIAGLVLMLTSKEKIY